MFARAQSQPRPHTGSGSGRKHKQGRRERVDPGGGEGQQTPSHGLSLADDMEGISDLTSHASHGNSSWSHDIT